MQVKCGELFHSKTFLQKNLFSILIRKKFQDESKVGVIEQKIDTLAFEEKYR